MMTRGSRCWSVEIDQQGGGRDEVQSEETGREMVGLVIPTTFDFFGGDAPSNGRTSDVQVEAPGVRPRAARRFHLPAGVSCGSKRLRDAPNMVKAP